MTNIQEGCICQECGKLYKIDVIVPDKIWNQIKPHGKPEGAGLLCGLCIFKRIENIFGNRYGVIYITEEFKGMK